MSRSVTGDLPIAPEVIVEKLEKLAVKHDIEFSGTVERGYARGKGFHVEYVVVGMRCTLTVTKKPLLVPWALVEAQLHKLFS
ncbi:MAG: hypothetical protein R3F47_20020 [Gammaproteobacteria bacterium]|jgi:hypothetical protein